MEAPPNLSPKKGRDEIFKKANEKNENYTLNIKLKDNNSIYIQKSDNFVEEFLQYLDSDDKYDTHPINWYEVVNELNRNTQLKFII